MLLTLKIDTRERSLIQIIQALIKSHTSNINLHIENLPLGDIIFYDEDTQQEVLIIERKSLSDLASSIKDGRYAEQSLRLTHLPTHNHNIMYLIEGVMDHYRDRYTRVTQSALYSSMLSLQYYKGFSVVRTFDIQETCEVIFRYFLKIQKETTKEPYYKNASLEATATDIECTHQTSQQVTTVNYCQVVRKVKKDNITPENIGGIILSQIPGISATISSVVMDKFGSLYDLMSTLHENPNCMNNMTYTTKSGQERRVSHKCISSIKEFLLYRQSATIDLSSQV